LFDNTESALTTHYVFNYFTEDDAPESKEIIIELKVSTRFQTYYDYQQVKIIEKN
jgi:hypothetical protein